MAKPYSLANPKLCYIPMLLNTEKSEEYDKERSKERLVNTDSGLRIQILENMTKYVLKTPSNTDLEEQGLANQKLCYFPKNN